MKFYAVIVALAIVTLFTVGCASFTQESSPPRIYEQDHVLLCAGNDEMFIIDALVAETGVIEKLWSWRAKDSEDVEADKHRWYNNLDECRTIDNGNKILFNASNGGCALIDHATKKILWYAYVTNAHSIELLPGDRVVVASSISGDELILFDLSRSNEPLFKTPLQSAHGVIWDEQRELLWALGYDELRSYELKGWETDKPSLELKMTYPLPNNGGHDLRAVPGTEDLVLTTGRPVLLFNRVTGTFRPHPTLGRLSGVKSIDVHPVSGRIVIGKWDAEPTLFLPAGKIKFSENTPYKIRWFVTGEPAQAVIRIDQ